MFLKQCVKRVFTLMLGAAFCLSMVTAIPAYAATKDELEEKQNALQDKIEAAQAEIDKLEKESQPLKEQISALDEKIKLVQEKVDNLQSQVDTKKSEISSLEAQISTIESNIKKVEQEIVELQAQIDEKQAVFDELYEEYCQRLRSVYISGSVTNLEVLMTSSDLSSLLTRAEMISAISKQDKAALDELIQMMEQIQEEKGQLQSKVDALEVDKKELESSKEDLLVSKQELDEKLAEVTAEQTSLNADKSAASAKLQEYHDQQNAYSENIYQYEAEQEKLEKEIQSLIQKSGNSGSSVKGSGVLQYPIPSRTTISAGYPYYSNGSWHGGVDFPASTGTSIQAADSGTVISVKYLNYSYGYHLLINHGNGLYTLYAHCSSILVSTGQTVSKGEVIAKVGSTGNSTGPHLHFEVRNSSGTQLNPLSYL
ncbi:MAG: DUF3450 family protein [Clostridiales bacterium]|nr:DUF3450 family protein [Clostridiales bacterium]